VAAIELRSVGKRYRGPDGPVVALDDVSLTVAAGQLLAVKGPSGCGKTTLLLTAGGLLRPDEGQVLLDGRDLYALSPEERAAARAATVGFVFQQFHLIPYLSVLDNVQTATLGAPAADNRGRAMAMLDRFGLADRAQHVPAELSTGERQRVALVRAMFNGPTLVLADEPTGNLDEGNAHIVLCHLAEYAEAGGAVLLVTHDSEAAQRAHRVIPLSKGRIVSATAERDPPQLETKDPL
jgi:ABC-type lipoprotein export system ATPase subunit